MTEEELFRLPSDERQHFAQCRKCLEWYDQRDLEGVATHLKHECLPDTVTVLESCPKCDGPMQFRELNCGEFVGYWTCSTCCLDVWAKTRPIRIKREAAATDEFSGNWLSFDDAA